MSNTAQIDESQLKSILDEVEAELGKLAKSDLAKARPGESTESEDQSASSTTDPTGGNTSTAAESPDAASASPDGAGSDDGSASAGPPPGADASAPPPGADDGSAPADASASPDASADPAADQGPIDPQALMAEYSKLSPEDQKLHYMCLKQVLMQTLAGAGADDGSGAAPPAPDASAAAAPPPAAAPAPAPDASAPAPALKAEIGMKEDPKANGENPLHKTEAEFNAAVSAQVQAAVGPLVKAVKHVLEAPLRKSISSIADLPAAAPTVDVSKMSREQMRGKLREKLQAGTLSKSDKDLMIQFDVGKVKADQIAHLLK